MSEPQEIVESIEKIKEWINKRSPDLINDPITVQPGEGLKSLGVGSLVLDTFEQTQQDRIVYSQSPDSQKPKEWTELSHLVKWVINFLSLMEKHQKELVALDLIRMNREYPLTLAAYNVEEAINIVRGAVTLKIPLNVLHPDTKGQNFAADNVLVEDSHSVYDIVREILIRLYSKCVVRLVVKVGHFYSAALSAFIVDLMHQAGATTTEIQIFAHDRRMSICSERLTSMALPNKHSKLSVFAVVFSATDLFAAVGGIIESYFREQYPNLIVLVEEGAYSRFVKYWQHYYSHSLHIGSRLDDKVTVVDTFNDKVTIDLGAIDLRQSHKLPGNAINVLRFKNLNDCLSMINQLRKIPLMSIWNSDDALSKEFCSRIKQCDSFWINHMPKYHQSDKLAKATYQFYRDVVERDMCLIYDKIQNDHQELLDGLLKELAIFQKKSPEFKRRLIFSDYVSAINKFKSLKKGNNDTEAATYLQAYLDCLHHIKDDGLEEKLQPMDLVIIYVAEEPSSWKQKALLLELVFKTLLVGSAVLLHCPPGTLGAKFSIDNDHIIPFKMLTETSFNFSSLSLEDSPNAGKKCPANAIVITYDESTTRESAHGQAMALAFKRKLFWAGALDKPEYWRD